MKTIGQRKLVAVADVLRAIRQYDKRSAYLYSGGYDFERFGKDTWAIADILPVIASGNLPQRRYGNPYDDLVVIVPYTGVGDYSGDSTIGECNQRYLKAEYGLGLSYGGWYHHDTAIRLSDWRRLTMYQLERLADDIRGLSDYILFNDDQLWEVESDWIKAAGDYLDCDIAQAIIKAWGNGCDFGANGGDFPAEETYSEIVAGEFRALSADHRGELLLAAIGAYDDIDVVYEHSSIYVSDRDMGKIGAFLCKQYGDWGRFIHD